MKKAAVLAGSRGIGKGIYDSLSELDFVEVKGMSSKELDTSNIQDVDKFIQENKSLDILVLNTGGPPSKKFHEITEEDCQKYHNQLFYGFFKILQNIEIKEGGYIFLISSYNIKEPNEKLILSNAYRVAFTSVLKSISKKLASKSVSTINIAPGPIDTDRIRGLVTDIPSLEDRIPMKRLGKVREIGDFVKSIVQYDIKYMTGVTINFDGGKSNYIL